MSETLRKYGAKFNTTFCSLCGLSTDTKPMGSFDGVGIANGSEFIEMDTGKKFKYDAESSVWNEVSSGGGGGGSTLIEKSITANGEYNASDDSADGYSKVTVDVANSYTQADEGKVVSNGALVAQTAMSSEVTENGTVDTTLYNSVTVNVPSGGGTDFDVTIKCKPSSTQQKRRVFQDKTWSGLTDFYGDKIWTDGDNIYYSSSSTQKVLDKSTSTWTDKTWNGISNINGSYIWTDGDVIYYSNSTNHYVLDKSTSTWSTKTWDGLTEFYGSKIWTDGTDIYYSNSTNHYVLDKSTSTWSTKTWNGLTNFDGEKIWSDGTDIYYSNGSTQYVLDKSTSTWNTKTWSGISSFDGSYIWTDGDAIYLSNSTYQYMLIPDTNKFTTNYLFTLALNTSYAYGNYVWTDGKDIYLSSYTTSLVLKTEEFKNLKPLPSCKPNFTQT